MANGILLCGMLVAGMFMLACRGPLSAVDESRAASDADTDAAVYAAALDTLFTARADASARRLTVNDSTTSYRREVLVPDFWNAFHVITRDTALVRNFEKASRIRQSLHPIEATLRLHVRSPIDLVNDTVLMQIRLRTDSLQRAQPAYPRYADGYWRTYYAAYPRSYGATRLSAIGYDQSVENALVYVEHGCGGLCGSGNIVLLHREQGRWRVVKIEMTWVS
jgi:hypothetical protein